MKNIKKEIPSIIGLVATASLAVVTGGFTIPAIGSVLGNVGSGIAANIIADFSPNKIKKMFVDVHPDKLNHSIKKLFVESISEALRNINVLFSETQATDDKKKQAKKLIKTLQKQLPDILLNSSQLQLKESEIEHFLYDKDKEDAICKYIETQFDNFGISEPFKSFLAQNLSTQIQLCFGEGLKNPVNQDAWVAFQRMLMEEIRSDIKNIADTQQEIKDDLSDLKFAKSGFSKKQIAEVHELIKLLNNKKLVEVKIRNSVNQSLKSIENKANEIIQITTKTQLTVDAVKTLVEKINKQNRINHLIIYGLSACLLAAGVFVVYKLIHQPFTTTVKVYGWENEHHYPLNGKGSIVLTFGDKTEKSVINSEGEAIFKGILPEYNNKMLSVYITDTENEPYYLKDSLVKVQKNSMAKVQVLLRGLEQLRGRVTDNMSSEGISDVFVTIAGITQTTDKQGFYSIDIPLEQQKQEQKVLFSKDGYYEKVETISMTGEYNVVLTQK